MGGRAVWCCPFVVSGLIPANTDVDKHQASTTEWYNALARIIALNIRIYSMSKSKPPIIPAPITSPKIRHIAGKGLKAPSTLTTKQVQELAASVEAHIEPRHRLKH